MQRVRRSAGRGHDTDMTQGSIFMHLLMFALPLLVGNIFQQFYNTVDTWVVGNYVSKEAFSAVGTVGPIVNMLIGAFSGLASGAGVVISQYYGAKNDEKVHDAVHTAIALTIILTVVFTIVGLLMTPYMLNLMKTPAEVFPESSAYLRIYFGGMIGLLFYNMGAGILRAVGDSKRPFYFLVVSAIINIVLDLLFVLKFNMGVAGVAWATIIAQGVSAILTMATLMRTTGSIRLNLKHIRIHMEMLKKIVLVGIPAALQMAVTAFSNVFVQSYINQFGTACMAGWTAYNKIDQLIFLPMQSLSLAATTFVGQNLGRAQVDRAKKGVVTTLIMAMVSTLIISVAVIIFRTPLVGFFNSDAEVIEYGAMFLKWLTPFYVLCCINQIYNGALRGSGDSTAPMIIMLLSFVAFRQAYLYVVSNFIANEVLPLAMGYPAGWLLCSLLTLIYYHKKANFNKNRLVSSSEVQPN